MEWMESQMNALSICNANPSYGSNKYAKNIVQELVPDCGETTTVSSGQIKNPRCSQTKGALRKLRKKGPLETSSKKAKVCFNIFFTY